MFFGGNLSRSFAGISGNLVFSGYVLVLGDTLSFIMIKSDSSYGKGKK